MSQHPLDCLLTCSVRGAGLATSRSAYWRV